MLARLDIVKQRFDEVSDLIIQPNIIADQKRYVQLTKEYKELKQLMDKREEYLIVTGNIAEAEEIIKDGSDPEMVEMAKLQLEEAKEKLPQLEEEVKYLLIPKDPEDSKNAVMEIRAGTGGDEASIFAGDLYRMYNKFEAGVHRVQRVPQTETQGRVHTSAATVMVLPEAEEFDVELNMEDVKIIRTTSTGPGGQSVNTTYSAIQLQHIPTGIEVRCQDEKSQHKNLDKALKVLRSRLYEMELAKKMEADSARRKSMVSSGDRSAKIRTYNYPQGRVTDHRIGLTLYDLGNIINGDIQRLIDELQLAENTEKLKEGDIF